VIDENSVAGENEMVILGISVNPISTRGVGADYAPHITTYPTNFQTFRHP
jgi:hypothetical protein